MIACVPLCGPPVEEEITKAVHALPNTRYYVDARDFYHNAVYQYTRYSLMQI